MSNKPLSIRDIENSLEIVKGSPDKKKLSLYAVIRNESFLIEAFLNHYRELGIEQFLILDDRSDDGTGEILGDQPDCVVLFSPFSYGDDVTVEIGSKAKQRRAGVLMKRAIPQRFLMGEYCLYADADEFLFMPAGISGVSELFGILAKNNIDCVAASMVEFYPADLAALSSTPVPELRSLRDLLDLYPYYDARPVVSLERGQHPQPVNDSASTRLFRKFGIAQRFGRFPKLSVALERVVPLSYRRSPRRKTPIMRWTDETWLAGSHKANVSPSESVLLAIGHFKFTHAFWKNIEQALTWRSHVDNAEKYESYARLLQQMKRVGGDFMGPDSREFKNTEQFIQYRIAKCDLRNSRS